MVSVENDVPYSVFKLLSEYINKLDKRQYRSFTEKISVKYSFYQDNYAAELMI